MRSSKARLLSRQRFGAGRFAEGFDRDALVADIDDREVFSSARCTEHHAVAWTGFHQRPRQRRHPTDVMTLEVDFVGADDADLPFRAGIGGVVNRGAEEHARGGRPASRCVRIDNLRIVDALREEADAAIDLAQAALAVLVVGVLAAIAVARGPRHEFRHRRPLTGEQEAVLVLDVTKDAARAIAQRAGRDLDALRSVALVRGSRPVPLGITASAHVSQTINRKMTANVVGVLKGTEPGEGIVYTAHYDHLGMRDMQPGDTATTDRIYNGALDNASGCAGLLEVAQAFARAASRPARSMYVAFTTAEESGLLGSEYFAAHLPLPAAKLAANINIDEVNVCGPAKDFGALGAERSSLSDVLRRIAERHGRVLTFDPAPERGYFYRSDHFPLAKVGIPAVSGSESTQFLGPDAEELKRRSHAYNDTDYHQPSDEMQPWWDCRGAVQDLTIFAELGWEVANTRQMPSYHADQQFAAPRK